MNEQLYRSQLYITELLLFPSNSIEVPWKFPSGKKGKFLADLVGNWKKMTKVYNMVSVFLKY